MRKQISAACVAVTVLVAACGGSLDAAEYFAELEEASAAYDETTDEIFDAYRTVVADALADFQVKTADADTATLIDETATLLDTTRTEVTSAFSQAQGAMSTFITSLEDLDPPAEAETAHDEALAALRRSRDAIPDLLNAFVAVQSLDDISAAINASTFGDTQPRVIAACLDLEGVAVEAGITVDLRCGSDDGR